MSLFSAFTKGSDARMYLRTFFSDFGKTNEERMERNGTSLLVRPHTSDTFVVDEVFSRTVYGPMPQGVVLDLGANIGAYSLYASQEATHVYAFEPESSNYAQLRKNILLNKRTNITAFKRAVGKRDGYAFLRTRWCNKGASSIDMECSGQSECVEMVTLERAMHLCGITHVDVLKVDIEGSEYGLFDGASTSALQNIDVILMELHHHPKKDVELSERLSKNGFVIHTTRTRMPPFGMQMLFAHRKKD